MVGLAIDVIVVESDSVSDVEHAKESDDDNDSGGVMVRCRDRDDEVDLVAVETGESDDVSDAEDELDSVSDEDGVVVATGVVDGVSVRVTVSVPMRRQHHLYTRPGDVDIQTSPDGRARIPRPPTLRTRCGCDCRNG